MNVAALIGHPVHHSVAPVLHEYLAEQCGVELRYLKLDVMSARLGETVAAMNTLGFVGWNVTIPHKQAIGRYLDRCDEIAQTVGAVNTVYRTPDGHTVGTNTDWQGIVGGLRQAGHPKRVTGGRATVLGSGGAARAAIYALQQLGYTSIDVFYLAPADKLTTKLQADFAATDGVTFHTYDSVFDSIMRSDVVCNMSSAGMAGNPGPFDMALLDGSDLAGKWFFDAVFNPLVTPLLDAAHDAGATTVDGLWMMIYQGLPAFEYWTDRKPKLTSHDLADLHARLVHAVDGVASSL